MVWQRIVPSISQTLFQKILSRPPCPRQQPRPLQQPWPLQQRRRQPRPLSRRHSRLLRILPRRRWIRRLPTPFMSNPKTTTNNARSSWRR